MVVEAAAIALVRVFESGLQRQYDRPRHIDYVQPPMHIYTTISAVSSTYDHRTLKTRLPVRSALFKQRTGGLVVRWVTTSEYPLLYVFAKFLQLPIVVECAAWFSFFPCTWKTLVSGGDSCKESDIEPGARR